MRKHILPLALACLMLAGCADKALVSVDLAALSQEILDSGAFDETLYQVDADAAALLLDMDLSACEESYVYVGTGATAEELVLLQAADEAGADALLEGLSTHLADRTAQYSAYLPEEAFKLESAAPEQYGAYVVLCISADSDKVEEILGSYLS